MAESSDQQPPEQRKRKRDLARAAIVLLVAVLLVTAIPGWIAWRGFTGPGPIPDRTTVLIEKGSGLSSIARQLYSEGLIESGTLFKVGVRLAGNAGSLKAGEYEVPRHASMRQIMRILIEGKPILHPITIYEGMTSWEVVQHLDLQPVLTGSVPIVPDEGTLLPETYLVTRGTSRQEVVDRMRAAQDDLLARIWPERKEGLPFSSITEALTLASIVEKETSIDRERPVVASVFINRLEKGMRLQTDPTIIYGITLGKGPLGRRIRQSELRAKTPYNTYQIDGLPPTPIANPGAASIEAVLQPAETDYLYFVADGTGGHIFAKTGREHNANVRKWRQIQRNRGLR